MIKPCKLHRTLPLALGIILLPPRGALASSPPLEPNTALPNPVRYEKAKGAAAWPHKIF
jgi:hypothetical protein